MSTVSQHTLLCLLYRAYPFHDGDVRRYHRAYDEMKGDECPTFTSVVVIKIHQQKTNLGGYFRSGYSPSLWRSQGGLETAGPIHSLEQEENEWIHTYCSAPFLSPYAVQDPDPG